MSEHNCKSHSCRCECGYRCGGPGYCKLSPFECLEQNDGQHYVRDCGHQFEGPMIETSFGGSVACQKCGMLSETHDMACGI